MTTKQTAKHNDDRIYMIALYTVTQGFTKYIEDESVTYDKAMEFKRLIKSGEFTLKQLEDDVYSKFGVMDKMEETPLEALREMSKEFDKRKKST